MPHALLTCTPASPSTTLTPAPAPVPNRPKFLAMQAYQDDVQRRAQAHLRACPYREVQHTTCHFNKGVMLLQGEVSSFYLKQIAQTVMLNVKGVRHIINAIYVSPISQEPTTERP